MAPAESKNNTKKTIIQTLQLFIFTIVVGFLAGTGLIPFLVPQSFMGGYLELLVTLISPQWFVAGMSAFVYKTIVLTWPFAIAGWFSKAWWILLVPITAYEMTNGLLVRLPLNSDFFRYIALHYFPTNSSDLFSYYMFYMAVIYALAFALVAGCYYAVTLRKTNWRLHAAMAVVLLGVIPAGTVMTINTIGTPLYQAERQAQDMIFIPSTDTVSGTGGSVYYAPMQHRAGVYQNYDTVSYKFIKSYDMRSTKKSCGASDKKTPAGHEYRSYTRSDEKAEFACFVIGSYKYTLERDYTFEGTDYLGVYPTETVVDAIYSGIPIVAGCSNLGLDDMIDLECNDEDKEKALEVMNAGRSRYTLVCKNANYDAQHQPICEKIVDYTQN